MAIMHNFQDFKVARRQRFAIVTNLMRL